MIAAKAKTFLPLAAVIALAAMAGAPAKAQSCGAEIDRLAQRYNLAPEAERSGTSELLAPARPSSPGAGIGAPQQRAQSSGAASPADTNSVAPIQPSPGNPGRAASPPGSAATESAGSALSAADRARMAALLDAARAAERQGKNADCLARLREAAAVPHAPTAR